ncbi:MAG: 4-(cytidine 5'-diphospho)-2-C-methyl-D-erythritol kinase [Candidatus Sumerlaeaceae bacterium]
MSTATLTIRSPAKLNWYLHVREAREDGFHDLETVFQELDLHDDLVFESVGGTEDCEIHGFPHDIPHESNLIFRAWKLLRDSYPGRVSGIRVEVNKRIPRGGGLGGGSSNAATTLVALDALYQLSLPSHVLESLGSELGSDVPFFIRGGTAIGRGRGELLESLPASHQFHLLLLFPPHGISTSEAYQRLDELGTRRESVHSIEGIQRALLIGNPYRLAAAIHNDFEPAVQSEPWFRDSVSALDRVGCLRAFLCGSGSTVAGLGKDNHHCVEMSERLCNILPYTQSVTCTLAGRRTS